MATYGNTPYGLRQIRFIISGTQYELPIAQTAEFEPTFESAELKGDDITYVKLANLQSVKITIKAGGLPLEVWTALLNGSKTIQNSGLSNESTTMTMVGGEVTQSAKMYAKLQGAGADNTHIKFYKVTLDSSKIAGGNANFMTMDATLTAVADSGTGKLFEVVQYKTAATLPTS